MALNVTTILAGAFTISVLLRPVCVYAVHPFKNYIVQWPDNVQQFTGRAVQFLNMSSPNSLYARLADHFRPHQAEALYRVRVNGTCLITGILVSYISPIPSFHKAVYVVRGSPGSEFGSGEWFYQWFCILGMSHSPFY